MRAAEAVANVAHAYCQAIKECRRRQRNKQSGRKAGMRARSFQAHHIVSTRISVNLKTRSCGLSPGAIIPGHASHVPSARTVGGAADALLTSAGTRRTVRRTATPATLMKNNAASVIAISTTNVGCNGMTSRFSSSSRVVESAIAAHVDDAVAIGREHD